MNDVLNALSRREFWTRKEIAQLLDVSVETIRRHENQLGLDKAKFVIGPGSIRYTSSVAATQLKRKGAFPPS